MPQCAHFPLGDVTNSFEPHSSDHQIAPWRALDALLGGDIDSPLQWDAIVCVPETRDSVYDTLRSGERRNRPSPTYMTLHRAIDEGMRVKAVNWLSATVEVYKIGTSETLFLAVSYLDRLLTCFVLGPDVFFPCAWLQLLAAGCLLIAAVPAEPVKFDEPLLATLVEATGRAFTSKDISFCGWWFVPKAIGDIDDVTVAPFVDFLYETMNMPATPPRDHRRRIDVSMCLCDLSLLEYGMLAYLPSQVAASSVLLANIYLRFPVWSDSLTAESKYSIADLRDCVEAMHKTFLSASRGPGRLAVTQKYNNAWDAIPELRPDWVPRLPDYLFS